MKRVRIVLGNSSLAAYPQGGGLWSVFLQYLLGLEALGHDVLWIELLRSTHDEALDRAYIDAFFANMRAAGVDQRCVLLRHASEGDDPALDQTDVYGMSRDQVREAAGEADLLWNFCGALRTSLLSLFRHRVFVDLDPGHLQISALTWNMGLDDHHTFLSVGRKLHEADCTVPTLGRQWHGFTPFVYLPRWKVAPDPGRQAPFTSITHWKWEELLLDGRTLSASKRTAYLRYLDLPRRAGRPFELAVNLHPDDATGDRELLIGHGWQLTHPYYVAGSPRAYREYIAASRAEISCPKPVFRELRTGWFSDRSACYLASGRPVLAEDTGFSEALPTGSGLLTFTTLEEAVAGVAAIDGDYARHQRVARELAEAHLDSGRTLSAMLSETGRLIPDAR